MTVEQKTALAQYLLGTCGSVEQALEFLGIDASVEEAEEALLDRNVERCPGCDWWMESAELVDDEGEIVGCDQCRPAEESGPPSY